MNQNENVLVNTTKIYQYDDNLKLLVKEITGKYSLKAKPNDNDFKKFIALHKVKKNTSLGLSSFKRLWGIETYQKSFGDSTLDAIAKIAEYSDWHTYMTYRKEEPILSELKREIAAKYDITPEDIHDCERLASKLNEEKSKLDDIKEKDDIKEATISSLWKYWKKGNTDNTLHEKRGDWGTICRILGHKGWNDFCAKHAKSDSVIDEEQLPPLEYAYPDLHLNHLSNDEEITIGFPPLKYCILKKLDDGEFEVVEQKGMFNQKGTILYIEKIVMERGTQKNAFPEIKYEYLPNVEDEDENGIIPESLYIPRSL